MKTKIKKIFLTIITIVSLSTGLLYADVVCYPIGGFDMTGHEFCGIGCTDNTVYIMPCDADIFD